MATSIVHLIAVLLLPGAPWHTLETPLPRAQEILRGYTTSLERCARGDHATAVAEIRAWTPDRTAVILAVVKTDLPSQLRWSRRQAGAAVLVHGDPGVALLREDRLSADVRWHLDVVEQFLGLDSLAADPEFRRDWYLLAADELHFAQQHVQAREMLARARRRLPESAALLFASGVTDEAIARLHPLAYSLLSLADSSGLESTFLRVLTRFRSRYLLQLHAAGCGRVGMTPSRSS